MPLSGASAGNVEGLVLNPAFAGLVSSYGPKDIGLSVHDLFPALTFTSNGNGTGFFQKYNLDENFQLLEDEDLIRRPASAAKKLNRSRRLETFQVNKRHLDAVVPDDVAKVIRSQTGGADDPNVTEVMWVRQRLLLQKEKRAADLARASASVAAELTPAHKWDDYTNGDPIADIQSAMAAVRSNSGLIPNVVAIPWEVALKLSYHPRFRVATPDGGSVRSATERAIVTAEGIAELLKAILSVDKVVILKSMAQVGALARSHNLNLQSLWGDDVFVYFEPPKKDLNSILWAADIMDTFYYGGVDTAGVFSFYDKDHEMMVHRVREDSDIILMHKEVAATIRDTLT